MLKIRMYTLEPFDIKSLNIFFLSCFSSLSHRYFFSLQNSHSASSVNQTSCLSVSLVVSPSPKLHTTQSVPSESLATGSGECLYTGWPEHFVLPHVTATSPVKPRDTCLLLGFFACVQHAPSLSQNVDAVGEPSPNISTGHHMRTLILWFSPQNFPSFCSTKTH